MRFNPDKLTVTAMFIELSTDTEIQDTANKMTDNVGYLFKQENGDLIMRNRRWGKNKRYPYSTGKRVEAFIRKVIAAH